MQQVIDFEAAERRAAKGMRRAAERACRQVDPLWVETAVLFLAAFAREQVGREFTIEQARVALAGKVIEAPNLRAWGQVTRVALQRGLIKRFGMARAASSNGSFKATYRVGKEVQ